VKAFHVTKCFATLLFPIILAGRTWAVSPDPRLLPLVSPGAQIVAGISAPSMQGQLDSFLLITRNNSVDLRDFFALSGVDDARIIHQIIMVAASDSRGSLEEHSLLASGHFDRARVFKAAVENGAARSEYRGMQVLVLQPFERERGIFKDVRWLVVLESSVAIFGTISNIKEELDRYLAKSTADSSLIQELARLHRDDKTWCVLKEFVRNNEIQHALGSLDSTLANLTHDGDAFQFGIQFGRRIRFEYEVTGVSGASAQAISCSLTQSLIGGNLKVSLLMPSSDRTANGHSARGVVKLSSARYETWLTEVSARGRARLVIASPNDSSVDDGVH
jgi:hypothetical protein